jgi:hypothetical protein
MTRSRLEVAAVVAAWLASGLLAYGGQMAHEKVSGQPWDALCREVNSSAVRDDRLAVDRSFFLIWGLAGGPISLLWTAAMTGFFHNGVSFT